MQSGLFQTPSLKNPPFLTTLVSIDERGDTVLSSVEVELDRVVFGIASKTSTPSTAVSEGTGSTSVGL